jgi:hypothetical protein
MKRKHSAKIVDFDLVSRYKREKLDYEHTYINNNVTWVYTNFHLKRKFYLI